ncbi:putative R3H domain-containing protein [Helianthus annuus]|nr:putative R3H domain-containing protein [Helianthus annuus]
MADSVADPGGPEPPPPDSSAVADLDATMSRLTLSKKRDDNCHNSDSTTTTVFVTDNTRSSSEVSADCSAPVRSSSGGALDELVNSVDQFLRDALRNPRERLSVLRMEQDVEKFIADPLQQQMEFQQLPTSYLRLAAHRVAQHYSLHSMVLLDNTLPDASGSRIIIRSSRSGRTRTEKEPVARSRSNSRVAIFRDREVEQKDPDYDRNYDRYAQRFDPGFAFNGGSYPIQPMYTPVVNYNTEFPQLSSVHRSFISTEHQPRALPQHLPGPWVPPAGIGYRPLDAMVAPFSPNHMGPHSASTLYMQYPCQRPMMTFIHPCEQVHQHYAQSQQQFDASFGLARPR